MAAAKSTQQLRRSVFKIEVVSQDINFERPWKHASTSSSSGTGFYIGNGMILTNAHVVANSRYMTVQRDGDSVRVPALVKFIAHDADLAVLSVDNPQYLVGVDPIQIGPLPRLLSPVSTIGFPTGGEQISITKGIVSRVGYRTYVHSGVNEHLLVQVDSAINAGNSGGPVVQGGRVVGVAFQSFIAAENTGYIIPTPVINRFLKDIEDGTYDGHVRDGIEFMRWSMTNPATQRYFGEVGKPRGVVISHIASWSCLVGKIEAGDLLLEIGGQKVGADGRIDFQGERVDFHAVFDLKQVGESIDIKIKKGLVVVEMTVTVKRNRKYYYAGNGYMKYPKYFVFAGLVFTTLSRGFLQTWGKKWYRKSPQLLKYIHYSSQYDANLHSKSEFVVLTERLPHPINSYLDSQKKSVVRSVDGVTVNSMTQFIELLEARDKSGWEFVSIEFIGNVEPVVLRIQDVASANTDIMQSYGIKIDRWTHGSEVDGAILALKSSGQQSDR